MSVLGFYVAMVAVKGNELTFLIFFLTTPPLVKYFFIHNLELRAHLGFYVRE